MTTSRDVSRRWRHGGRTRLAIQNRVSPLRRVDAASTPSPRAAASRRRDGVAAARRGIATATRLRRHSTAAWPQRRQDFRDAVKLAKALIFVNFRFHGFRLKTIIVG